MNTTTCCFTGHRNISESRRFQIEQRLEKEIAHLIHQGVDCFLAGGALGFDTMAALAVLNFRNKYPGIQLILVLPCENQTDGWNGQDIKTYNQIREQADRVVYASEQY